jgi:hypothetical protein
MNPFDLSNSSDDTLVRHLHDLVQRDRAMTAALLAHLSEVDVRRLWVEAAYPSMLAWCVGELRFSEDAASRRLSAARVARKFPLLFMRLVDGSIHLTAINLLGPHLTPENCEELVELAARCSKSELLHELARRTTPLFSAPATPLTLGANQTLEPGPAVEEPDSSALARVNEPFAPVPVPVEPKYVLRVALERETQEKLEYARSLLSHAVPSGNVATVIDRALDVLIRQMERRKFASTPCPKPPRVVPGPPKARRRPIPAAVRRAVWERDGGACTFQGAEGRVCGSRIRLEYDHVEPVVRGGIATLENLRLRCRVHNRLEAERAFGKPFVERKLRSAMPKTPPPPQPDDSLIEDVARRLRNLGFRADEVRRGALYARRLSGTPISDRMFATLRFLRPPKPPRFVNDGGGGSG